MCVQFFGFQEACVFSLPSNKPCHGRTSKPETLDVQIVSFPSTGLIQSSFAREAGIGLSYLANEGTQLHPLRIRVQPVELHCNLPEGTWMPSLATPISIRA